MAFALVGTPAVNGLFGSAPAWGTGETRAAGNLLICWVAGSGASGTTLPATPTGWSIAKQQAGAAGTSSIFFLIATGGDAAPAAQNNYHMLIAEFSGGATVSPVDRTASASGTTSPLVATAAGVDAAAGELVVYCSSSIYSTQASRTLTNTLNNGASASETDNIGNGVASSTAMYDFGYGITTGNASADSDSFAFTTQKITGASLAVASFQLAPPAPEVFMSPFNVPHRMPLGC